jgi:hypothetical protein
VGGSCKNDDKYVSVKISLYLDGSFELKQNGLGDEDLAGLCAKVADLSLEKLDLLAGTAAPHLEEAVDYGVEIDVVLVRHGFNLSIPPSTETVPKARGGAGVGGEGRFVSRTPRETLSKKQCDAFRAEYDTLWL